MKGLAANWKRGGRFYRGWWQQIDKEDRCKIYINDKPTLEVDFKAFHPNLLSNELGVSYWLMIHMTLESWYYLM
jgi:hypothetical protein